MTPRRHATYHTSYEDRAAFPYTSPLQVYLLHLIALKKTNLCVSADVSTTAELLSVAEEVGDSICILKTHADIIDDWGDRTVRGLREIARRKRFLIFEDRKFGDIGSMFHSSTATQFRYRHLRRVAEIGILEYAQNHIWAHSNIRDSMHETSWTTLFARIHAAERNH